MKEKNVAFIIHALSNGGAERIMSYLTQSYSCAENKYLIVYHRSDIEYDFSGQVISLDTNPSDNILGKILNYINRIYKLRKIKKELNIDKSISMLDSPNIMNILSKRRDKVIISLRNHKSKEYTGLKKFLYNKVIKFLYNKADKIVAISEGVAEDLIQNINLDREKIEVIYNPVDLNKIQNTMKEDVDEFKGLEDKRIIINSGRLTNQKGQWHLLKSFKEVLKINPDVVLAILGQGELEMALKKLAIKLGIENNVIFLGYQKNPFKYINRADIFILSSLFEGFGNVIVEAMACEVPVISTDCKSGPREILSENKNLNIEIKEAWYAEYGVLIPNFDGQGIDSTEVSKEEKILSEVIINLLNDHEKCEKYSRKGIERLNEFDMKKITSKWEYI